VGEVAAAWTAGLLSLPQAVRVIYQRSQAQAKTQGLGRMAAVGISLPIAEQLLADLALTSHIEIAGINSENSLTLSGELAALELLAQQPEIKGKLFKILDLDYAFHSRAMDSVQTELLAALADLKPNIQANDIQFISTVTGQVWDKSQALDAHYWWLNIREPVRFAAAIQHTIQQGSRVFLEITPHPILRGYITEALNSADVKGLVLATARNKQESLAKLEQAAFATHLAGCPLDLSAWFKQPGQFVNLPNYPWQRERYWYPLTEEGYDLVNRHRSHPLLGYRLKDAEATWENQLDTTVLPYLADHIVGEAVVVPAAAYIEMALAAAMQWQTQPSYSLENLEIYKPIVLEAETTKTVRLLLNPADGSFKISSKDRLSTDEWMLNVVGRLTGQVFKAQPNALAITALQAAATHVVNKQQHYQLTQQVGLTYQTAFQGVQQVWVSELAALAELQTPDCLKVALAENVLHPALLDAGFQVLVDIFQQDLQTGKRAALIPIQVGKLQLYHNNVGLAPSFIQVTVKKQSPRSVVANFVLTDHAGAVLAELENCRFRGVEFNNQSQAPGLYSFEPILLPRLPAPNAISVATLVPLAQAALESQAKTLNRAAHFNEIVPLYDVLVGRYTWDALQDLVGVEQAFSLDDLIAKGVKPVYLPLLKQLLQLLVLHELALELDTDTWQLLAEIEYPEAAAIWLSLMETPEYLPELTWLGRSGEHLRAVLTGKLAASEVLSPAKSSIQAHWQAASPTWQALNPTLQTLVKELVAKWANHQRIRVLELRANSDVLTPALLAVLPAAQTDYVIAELSAEGLAQAQDTYSEYDYVQCVQLAADLSGDAYQILLSQGFDLIIAGNVLHQLTPLPTALRRLQALFLQGGVVLALEHLPDTLITFTEGLASQHWLAVEDDKQSHVLRRLPVATWQTVLTEAGLINVHCLLEPNAIGEQGACLLMAEAQAQSKIPTETVTASEQLLITADNQGYSYDLAAVLQAQLSAAGHTVKLSTHLEQTLQAVTETAFSHIVHLAGLAPVSQLAEHSLLNLQTSRCTDLISLVQTLEALGEHRPRLWLITAGASPVALVNPAPLLPEQAPLWGFGRVLMNEHPDLKPSLIDLQTNLTVAQAAELLSKELLLPANEDELVLGAEARYGLRLKPATLRDPNTAFTPDVCLDFTAPGFKHLYWKALPIRPLGAHEIEIKPYATGLNFRDVMYALGWLSDEAVENGFAGASLGMELAGKVVRVGAAVNDFKVGQSVIGFAPACFSSSVITETTAVAIKPDAWSYEAAATIPATFFTVYYALRHLAQLEAGEKVLIHGAAGGIGLAAIQYARYCGVEIFATAGTEEKRDLVRLMGADHVFDSRSLKFADDILALTEGKGVDVVLNSIAGEAINRNLTVLKPFGRFLELGKRDFYENTKIGLRPFRNNITYYGIDADQLLIEKPKLAKRLFAEMMVLFQDGALRPLPHRVFSANQIQDAFRYMQQSRQIGKVIVSFAEGYPKSSLPEIKTSALDLSQGSYLITGGLAGFGLETARWLVSKGAKSLILVSRSGATTQTAQQAIAEFQVQGVQVAAYACDITDKAALAQVLQTAEQTLPTLNGIIHAATVLDDGIIRKLDAERFQTVLAPKMLGAWHLHELTQAKLLQFFVLYSSVTTYLGNPGQANYVAANTYLEALAHYRRQQGLAAHYIAWGPIDDVGMLARNTTVKNSLQNHLGGKALQSQQALQHLEQVLSSNVAGVAVVNWDWRNIQKFMPSAHANKYANLWRRLGKETNSGNADIRSLIEGKSVAEVKALLTQSLLSEISKILRLPIEKLATNKPITELGMDSLMGMELVSIIEDRFTVKLPVMALTDGASVEKVAEKLAQQLLNEQDVAINDAKALTKQIAMQQGSELTETTMEQLAQIIIENDSKKASDMNL
jgi:acyl transferase domain-containing protein/NADPH:quinone reductase-like Zn-dependent oxidoreductase/short-subunit dehydrogenase/acyl carrier protein